jgi:DNA polymerase III subunit delta
MLKWVSQVNRGTELLYILWGEDQYSIEEKLVEIKTSLGDLSLLSTNTSILEGQKLTVNELKAVGVAMPFLSSKRLVIIKGLLERFEPKSKSSSPKKSSGNGVKTDESRALADCIIGFPESTVTIMTDVVETRGSPLKNNPLFNALAGKAETTSFPLLKSTKLSQWVQNRATKLGGSISTQSTNLLIELIGGDLYIMTNELNKLVAFTGGRRIEEKDVRAVVTAAQEVDIFTIVDAIMDRQAGLAEQILHKLFQNGVVPPQILVLLARQVQTLVQLKELKSQKRPSAEIQAKTGLFNIYAWSKLSSRADKYTMDRLKMIYHSILQTDLAIKTGKYDGDLALNLLIADLCNPEKI